MTQLETQHFEIDGDSGPSSAAWGRILASSSHCRSFGIVIFYHFRLVVRRGLRNMLSRLLCGSVPYSFGEHHSRRLCISISDLEKDEYVIGRKATADIVIPEPAISNVHCTITRV